MGKMIKEQVDNGMDSKANFIMNDLKPLIYEWLHHAWLKMKDKKLMMVKGWKKTKMIKAWLPWKKYNKTIVCNIN
jgi:hypothetical protein